MRERDGGKCVLCGLPCGEPNAHFIRRSRMGKGIAENIFTACHRCHQEYDTSPQNDRGELYRFLRGYLQSKYPDWDESELVYRKYE